MLQIELGEQLENRLTKQAGAEGVSVDTLLSRVLVSHLPVVRTAEEQAKRTAAIEELRTFSSRHNITLPPGMTIKDMINEGRKF